MLALDVRDRVEVAGEGLLDLGPLVVLEPPHAGAGREVTLGALHGRDTRQQGNPRLHPRVQQHVVQHALGVLEREPELAVLVAGRERAHLVEVRLGVRPDHPLDRVVRQRLGEPEQRQRRRHPPQVPGEVAEERLVEVVDVEHEDPGGVHVRAEVLGVQVALDPHATGALVGPRVLELHHVRVEERRAAAVERERRRRHLAELAPERARVGLDQLAERVGEHARRSPRCARRRPSRARRASSRQQIVARD